MLELQGGKVIGKGIVGGVLKICPGHNAAGMINKSQGVLPGKEYTAIFVAAILVGAWNNVVRNWVVIVEQSNGSEASAFD